MVYILDSCMFIYPQPIWFGGILNFVMVYNKQMSKCKKCKKPLLVPTWKMCNDCDHNRVQIEDDTFLYGLTFKEYINAKVLIYDKHPTNVIGYSTKDLKSF